MSTTEIDAAAGAHAPATETEGAHLLKRNSDDVGWQYGSSSHMLFSKMAKCLAKRLETSRLA